MVRVGDDDDEGIPAFLHGIQWVPLIASDSVRLDQITDMAQRIADTLGVNFEVLRFSVREKVGEIKSKKVN